MKDRKTRRDILFAHGKPNIRNADDRDVGWLWAAHKAGGGTIPKDHFRTWVSGTEEPMSPKLSEYTVLWMLEDRNPRFKDKFGPVGIVAAMYNNWVLEPHVEWFPWVTNKNKLRCSVAFFMAKARYSKHVGVCIVHSLDEFAGWFASLTRYVPIFKVGKVPGGNMVGNETLFYIRGKKRGVKDGRKEQGRQHEHQHAERSAGEKPEPIGDKRHELRANDRGYADLIHRTSGGPVQGLNGEQATGVAVRH